MRKVIRSLTILAVLGSAAQAAPFLAMGDSAEVFLTARSELRSDDKHPAQFHQDQRYHLRHRPRVELLYGQNALTKGKAYYQETIQPYSDNNKFEHFALVRRLRRQLRRPEDEDDLQHVVCAAPPRTRLTRARRRRPRARKLILSVAMSSISREARRFRLPTRPALRQRGLRKHRLQADGIRLLQDHEAFRSTTTTMFCRSSR